MPQFTACRQTYTQLACRCQASGPEGQFSPSSCCNVTGSMLADLVALQCIATHDSQYLAEVRTATINVGTGHCCKMCLALQIGKGIHCCIHHRCSCALCTLSNKAGNFKLDHILSSHAQTLSKHNACIFCFSSHYKFKVMSCLSSKNSYPVHLVELKVSDAD